MKNFKKILSSLLTAILIFTMCFSTYASGFEPTTNDSTEEITGEKAYSYVEQAVALIMSRYKFDVKTEELYKAALEKILTDNPELMESAFKGMFDALDEHSIYYTEDELNSYLENLSGEVCGIGVLITLATEGLIISNVYNDTPAKEAGLKTGDIITHAGGVYLGGMDFDLAKQYVLGEEYTPVTITILRDGTSFDVTLIRRKINVAPGEYQIVEDGTMGYIHLTDFNNSAADFIEDALEEFDKNGIKDIIIDIRNNPGGGLNVLLDICSLFIPSGPAIHLEYKNPLRFSTLYAENESEVPKYNLAILVNEYSASAAEAFAGAVQDTGVGIVIGNTTYGKGTMQNIIQFKIGGGAKITEAVYLTPNGRSVNQTGITPDVMAVDKISKYEYADIEPMKYERVLKIGDTGKDVKAIEERLRLLGYSIGVPDEVFDMQTYLATLSFQKVNELYPYGVMDYTTQAKLDSVLNGSTVKSDTSYKKAVEIFKSGNWEDYKQDWSNTDNN